MNHTFPSGPAVMPPNCPYGLPPRSSSGWSVIPSLNSVTWPPGVMRPIVAPSCVNQRFPSGPRVIAGGCTMPRSPQPASAAWNPVMPAVKTVGVPWGVTCPTCPLSVMNQTWPSGPGVTLPTNPWVSAGSTRNSSTFPWGVTRPTAWLAYSANHTLPSAPVTRSGIGQSFVIPAVYSTGRTRTTSCAGAGAAAASSPAIASVTPMCARRRDRPSLRLPIRTWSWRPRPRSTAIGSRGCASSRAQGVHHITLDRRRPADVDRLLGGRARDAVRLRAAEPRQPEREPPLLRPGRRAADHDLHQRGAHGRPGAHADGPGLRAPHRVLGLAGDVRADGRAARRARDRAQRREGPRLHGLDLLQRPARAADRARLLPLRAAARARRTPTCCSRRTGCASSAATTTSTASTSPTRSRRSRRARRESLSDDRSPKDPYGA